MEDYRSNKQTLGESLKDQFVDESQPEECVGDKQSEMRLRDMKSGVSN